MNGFNVRLFQDGIPEWNAADFQWRRWPERPQGRDGKMSNQIEGRCLCGAVRFVAKGAPTAVAWCHCQSCRKHSGAPVSVFVAFRRDAWAMTEGEIARFNSSPGRLRGFCARCGSTLTCEGETSPDTHFHIGAFAFDDAARLTPTMQFFPEERLPWFPSTDGTAL